MSRKLMEHPREVNNRQFRRLTDSPGSNSVICLLSAWPVTAKVFAASEACTLGLLKWMTEPSSLIMFTSSMPGIVFTESFFSDDCSRLSSVVAVRCTTF